jgi:hypothetical protein
MITPIRSLSLVLAPDVSADDAGAVSRAEDGPKGSGHDCAKRIAVFNPEDYLSTAHRRAHRRGTRMVVSGRGWTSETEAGAGSSSARIDGG